MTASECPTCGTLLDPDGTCFRCRAQPSAQVPGVPESTPEPYDRQPPIGEHGDLWAVFWDARPELATIRTWARARRVAPWAVLGNILARVVASVPPNVVLPPIVGGHGSLNLFVAITGPSGSGKGSAARAAGDAFPPMFQQHSGEPVPVISIGSGEGIAHIYMRREVTEKGKPAEVVQHTKAALIDVAEVDTLAALSRRDGSTLLSELRKAWSGEQLGFQNADATRRLPVEAHSYRLALVVGVQPGRAKALLDDADGGTPQRFVWLPATDPDAPDAPPAEPGPLAWSMQTAHPAALNGTRCVIGVAEGIEAALTAHRLATLRGTIDNPLDAHAPLARLKVAAALSLLDRRLYVNEDDWTLAGFVMSKSDATREHARRVIAETATRAVTARAEARAEAEVIVADRLENVTEQRLADGIIRRLGGKPDGMTLSEIKRTTKAKYRDDVEAVLADLVNAGLVIEEAFEYRSQPGTRYRLAVRGVPPVHP